MGDRRRHTGSARRRRRLVLLGLVGLVAAGAGIAVERTHLLRRIELGSVDLRFRVRGHQPTPRRVAVVAIDDATLRARGGGALRRHLHGELIDRLHADGARVIAYDIGFVGTTTPREDDALVAAIARARDVVLGTDAVDPRGQPDLFTLPGFPSVSAALASIGAVAGMAVYRPDEDGVIRRVQYAPEGLESLPVAAARLAGAPVRSLARGGGALIDYAGPAGTVPTYSFARVLAGDVPASAFRGRVVVVGQSIEDRHATPEAGALMPGAEIHANAIATLLRGRPLSGAGALADGLLALLAASIAPLAGRRPSALRPLLAAAVFLAIYLLATQLAFDGGTVLSVTGPLAALAVGTVGTISVNYLLEIRERRRLREHFGRFVPDAIVDEVVEAAAQDLRLGGVRREGTVVFADLRGFTAAAESLRPEQVIELLNRYLTEMSDAILDHGGTVVSYMGDGIMGVFGAPLPQVDHAARAFAAALEMLGPRLEQFNTWVQAAGMAQRFRLGVGLNSGPVMSGNVGSRRRLEYTAVGDTTNVAARLQAMTKKQGRSLLVSGRTRLELGPAGAALESVGEVTVEGRVAPLSVWGLAVEPLTPEVK